MKLRLEIAETVLDLWDTYGFDTAQDLLNWIRIDERPRTPWLPPP